MVVGRTDQPAVSAKEVRVPRDPAQPLGNRKVQLYALQQDRLWQLGEQFAGELLQCSSPSSLLLPSDSGDDDLSFVWRCRSVFIVRVGLSFRNAGSCQRSELSAKQLSSCSSTM